MKKRKKRILNQIKSDQLSLDFNLNIPIEIHKPKSDIFTMKKDLAWERRPVIEIVKS